MNTTLLPPLLGVFGMIAAIIIYSLVMKYPDGEEKVKKIGDQIHKGALAFMKTEYKYLIIFILVLVVLAGIFLGKETAIAVIVGAACSSLAGFIGMYAATKARGSATSLIVHPRTKPTTSQRMVSSLRSSLVSSSHLSAGVCTTYLQVIRYQLRWDRGLIPYHRSPPCLSWQFLLRILTQPWI